MTRRGAFLVVAVMLCIIRSSDVSDALQCTGKGRSDGQFFFIISYGFKETVSDCETQWLINGKVVGLSDADGNTTFILPITMATGNTSVLQFCPENLKYLIICPASKINEEEHCSCDVTPPTTFPEVSFPKWKVGVAIGVSAFLILLGIFFIVLCLRRQNSGYGLTSPVPD